MEHLNKLKHAQQEALRSTLAINSPRQCVREIVRNSLMAGATALRIKLNLHKMLVCVEDNGSGISQEKLQFVATRRWSGWNTGETHKHDNFKGDTLASIVHVSDAVKITARTANCDETWSCCLYKPPVTDLLQSSTSPSHVTGNTCTRHVRRVVGGGVMTRSGTRVLVQGLFGGATVQRPVDCRSVKRQCLSVYRLLVSVVVARPDLAVRLCDLVARRTLLDVPAGSSHEHRYQQLVDRHTQCRPLGHVCLNNVQVSGFICTHHARRSRLHVHVNGFLISACSLHTVIKRVMVESQRYPSNSVFYLFLTCPRHLYRVSIEPHIDNVEFIDHDSVMQCLKTFLLGNETTAVTLKACVNDRALDNTEKPHDPHQYELCDVAEYRSSRRFKRKLRDENCERETPLVCTTSSQAKCSRLSLERLCTHTSPDMQQQRQAGSVTARKWTLSDLLATPRCRTHATSPPPLIRQIDLGTEPQHVEELVTSDPVSETSQSLRFSDKLKVCKRYMGNVNDRPECTSKQVRFELANARTCQVRKDRHIENVLSSNKPATPVTLTQTLSTRDNAAKPSRHYVHPAVPNDVSVDNSRLNCPRGGDYFKQFLSQLYSHLSKNQLSPFNSAQHFQRCFTKAYSTYLNMPYRAGNSQSNRDVSLAPLIRSHSNKRYFDADVSDSILSSGRNKYTRSYRQNESCTTETTGTNIKPQLPQIDPHFIASADDIWHAVNSQLISMSTKHKPNSNSHLSGVLRRATVNFCGLEVSQSVFDSQNEHSGSFFNDREVHHWTINEFTPVSNTKELLNTDSPGIISRMLMNISNCNTTDSHHFDVVMRVPTSDSCTDTRANSTCYLSRYLSMEEINEQHENNSPRASTTSDDENQSVLADKQDEMPPNEEQESRDAGQINKCREDQDQAEHAASDTVDDSTRMQTLTGDNLGDSPTVITSSECHAPHGTIAQATAEGAKSPDAEHSDATRTPVPVRDASETRAVCLYKKNVLVDSAVEQTTSPSTPARELSRGTSAEWQVVNTGAGCRVYINCLSGLSSLLTPPSLLLARSTGNIAEIPLITRPFSNALVLSESTHRWRRGRQRAICGATVSLTHGFSPFLGRNIQQHQPIAPAPPTTQDHFILQDALNSMQSLNVYKSCVPGSSVYKISPQTLTNMRVFGQVGKQFIAGCVEADVVLLFDQHAVSERIRLEQILSEYNVIGVNSAVTSCDLPSPVLLQLTRPLAETIDTYNDVITRYGFRVSVTTSTTATDHANNSSEATVHVHGAPLCLITGSKHSSTARLHCLITDIITELANNLLLTDGAVTSLPASLLDVFKTHACHSAVRFGDSLTVHQCCQMIEQLSGCQLPLQCAHGRPSVVPLVVCSSLPAPDCSLTP